MTTNRRNKIFYWLFKFGGVGVSCALPIWAICEKFPMWIEKTSTGRSVGVGIILTLIVLTVIFRKTVFALVKDKLKLTHTPPVVGWIVMLIVSYILLYIANFLHDLTTVLWMGLFGCALGNVVMFIGDNFFSENEKAEKDEAPKKEEGEINE